MFFLYGIHIGRVAQYNLKGQYRHDQQGMESEC